MAKNNKVTKKELELLLATAMAELQDAKMRMPLEKWRRRRLSLGCAKVYCLATPCLVLSCLALPCHAMPCHAMPCHALPCHVLSCLVLCLDLFCLVMFSVVKADKRRKMKALQERRKDRDLDTPHTNGDYTGHRRGSKAPPLKKRKQIRAQFLGDIKDDDFILGDLEDDVSVVSVCSVKDSIKDEDQADSPGLGRQSPEAKPANAGAECLTPILPLIPDPWNIFS
jgi:hypothetical protein